MWLSYSNLEALAHFFFNYLIKKLGFIPPGESHPQSVLHVDGQRHLGDHRVALHHLYMISMEDGSCDKLHLIVCKVLPQAQPRSAIESRKFVCRLAHEAAIPEPPLWLVVPAVLPPYALHSPHGVHGVYHLRSFLQYGTIRKYIIFYHLSKQETYMHA